MQQPNPLACPVRTGATLPQQATPAFMALAPTARYGARQAMPSTSVAPPATPPPDSVHTSLPRLAAYTVRAQRICRMPVQ